MQTRILELEFHFFKKIADRDIGIADQVFVPDLDQPVAEHLTPVPA